MRCRNEEFTYGKFLIVGLKLKLTCCHCIGYSSSECVQHEPHFQWVLLIRFPFQGIKGLSDAQRSISKIISSLYHGLVSSMMFHCSDLAEEILPLPEQEKGNEQDVTGLRLDHCV